MKDIFVNPFVLDDDIGLDIALVGGVSVVVVDTFVVAGPTSLDSSLGSFRSCSFEGLLFE